MQGPALYVYNNATFTKEDWKGIKSPRVGSKKDDPDATIRITPKRPEMYPILRRFIMVTQKQPFREAIVLRD